MTNFRDSGINDRASSVVVDSGDWIVCDDSEYRGRCVLLRRGAYESLRGLGVDNRISSVRTAARGRGDYTEAPVRLEAPNYEYRRRPYEPVDEARVTSVRAVVRDRDRDRQCWVESEQADERGPPNVGGAVAGALIGGVIGHQIGGGRGKTLATAGGVAAGAVVGANVGRNRDDGEYDRDVTRCESRSDREPEYWDVTYEYRGVEHYVKMTAPPGRTVLVNRNGEPRQ